LIAGCFSGSSQVNVLTHRNDLGRTGQNTNETVLTPANVNTNSFGQLFSYAVDGQVFSQPLYVSGLAIPGQGIHNVVFVATMHDSVYAFDADSNQGANGGLLWHVSLGTSAVTPNNDFGNRYGAYHDIRPEVGIVGTPVIDLGAKTLFVDAFTHEGTNYVHRVHALSILNGGEQSNSPVVVSAAIPGNGVGSSGGVLAFDPMNNGLQRPALTLVGGILYVTFDGFADTDPYHGWILGYNASTLQLETNRIFNTTPNSTVAEYGANAGEGGLWMAGNGLAVDAATNIYFMVANGVFNVTNAGATEYGDSFVRLSTTNGLSVADYFTPYDQAALQAGDTDLGSGGAVLLPDSAGSLLHPHLIVGAGKSGTIYLVDRDAMGHYNSTDNSQIVQSVSGAIGGSFCTPAYFNNRLYYQCIGDQLKVLTITNGVLSSSALSQSAGTIGFPGASPSVSANGTNNAIVWVLDNSAVSSGTPSGPAILHAYNAYNLAQELYNSSQAGARDVASGAVKHTVPTIANGKVYVGGASALGVYGTGSFLAAPVINPAGGVFTNSVTVRLSDASPGATLYYTLDGSTPTTNASFYAGAFVLTNTTVVTAGAFEPGYLPSHPVSATFINGASSYAPDFLKQEFYSGAVRTNLEDPNFSAPPTFINYLTSFETPSGQGVNYAERVSGYFIAPQTTNYVFFVCSDDDSDLFLSTDSSPANKQLIAQETAWSNSREWVSSTGGSDVASKRSDQFTGTTWPGGNTIQLTAGTAYYMEGDHHQGGGGDDFAATFKFASAPDPIDGDAPALTGDLVATYAYNNTFVTITASPVNAVAVQGLPATFTVTATSGYVGGSSGGPNPAILYQWQSAPAGASVFTNIPNASGGSYSTWPLMIADNGRQFRVLATTAGSSATSSAATVLVVHDSTVPLPVRVTSVNSTGTALTLTFSKPLDTVSAQTAANYVFSPGNVAAVTATLDASGTNLTLTTGTALPYATVITLAISGVRDLNGNSVPPGTAITFSLSAPGSGSYAQTVLADGPLGYWRLNESAGPTAYDAVGAHNGTYASGATPGVPGPRPPPFTGFEATNKAVETFNGILNSYVAVPFGTLGTNTVTFAAWVYPIGVEASWSGVLMSRGNGASGGMGYNDQQMLAYTWNNNNSDTYGFVSGLVIPTNQWSLIAMAIYPSQAILSLANANGLTSATNAIAHTPDVFGNNWQIGNDNNSGDASRTFNGTIDEVAVFTKNLSAARLAAYYQAATQGGSIVTNGTVLPSGLRFTSIDLVAGQIVLQWIGSGTLEEAFTATGPWTVSASQNNPVIVPVSGTRFYRLRGN